MLIWTTGDKVNSGNGTCLHFKKPSHFRSVSLLQWHLPVSEIVRHQRHHLRPPLSNYRYVLSNVHGHISVFIPVARDAEDKRLITWVQCLLCKVCKLTHWHRVRHKLIIAVCLEYDLILRNKHVSLCHVSRWPLTAEGWVRTQVSPCGICGQSGTRAGFSEFFGFPCRYHSTAAVHTYISPGGWTTDLLVVAVQRHSLTQWY
jgi:hypothetical protein